MLSVFFLIGVNVSRLRVFLALSAQDAQNAQNA
jgi:hypothetical protein